MDKKSKNTLLLKVFLEDKKFLLAMLKDKITPSQKKYLKDALKKTNQKIERIKVK